jgi:hypothetical protein
MAGWSIALMRRLVPVEAPLGYGAARSNLHAVITEQDALNRANRSDGAPRTASCLSNAASIGTIHIVCALSGGGKIRYRPFGSGTARQRETGMRE